MILGPHGLHVQSRAGQAPELEPELAQVLMLATGRHLKLTIALPIQHVTVSLSKYTCAIFNTLLLL